MIIGMNNVRKANVSVRQIVTKVFLIQGNLRSDYKSHRSIIVANNLVYYNTASITVKRFYSTGH